MYWVVSMQDKATDLANEHQTEAKARSGEPTIDNYKERAREFGCHLRIGKYGINFLPRDPNGRIYKPLNIIPLDGWVTDPQEVERIIRENGMEL